MNKRLQAVHKIFSVISGISLVFNSLLPASLISLITAPPAYAQEATPTSTVEPTQSVDPTPTIAVTETPTPTVIEAPTPTPTDTITPTPTDVPTPTEEATPTAEPTSITPTPTEVTQPTETGPPATPTPEQGQILDGASTIAPTPTETATPSPTPAPETEHGTLQAMILHDTNAKTLDINFDSTQPSGSATLTTDKADYAPTDAVVIAGTGFTAGETYTLIITSQDPPPVTHEAQVTAGANGDILYTYQLDGNYRPNYQVVAKDGSGNVVASTTFTDGKKNTTTTLSSGSNPSTYGQPITFTATVTKGGADPTCGTVDFKDSTTVFSTITLASNTAITSISSLSAGSHSISAEYVPATSGCDFNGSTSSSLSQVVNKANQTITVTSHAPVSPDYNTSFTVAATGGGSGNSVTYSSGTPSVCTNVGATFTMVSGTGTCTVQYDQAGTTNYNAATQVTEPTTASKANPTITFGAAPTPTYLGGNFTVSATTTNTDSTTVTYSWVSGPCDLVSGAIFSSSGAGTCVVQANGAATTNFNAASNTQGVTIGKANQATLIVTGLPPSATYGQAQAITAGTSGGSGSGAVTFSAGVSDACTVNSSSGAVTITSGTGTCSITATQATDINYNSITSAGVSITITKATSTTVVTCPVSETYTGSALTPCTVSVTGAGGLNLTPDSVYTSNTDVGTANASYNYAGDANHEISSGSDTFKITKALSSVTVTCPTIDQTYTGLAQTPCTASYSTIDGLSESLTPTYSPNINVGTVTAAASYAGDANHESNINSSTFEISKADPICSITGYSGIYDAGSHGATGSCKSVSDETLSGLDLGDSFTNVPGGTAH